MNAEPDSMEYCIAPDNNIYIKMIRLKGHKKQISKAVEEMGELSAELANYLAGDDNQQAIISEIADVENLMIQMRILFDPDNKIDQIKVDKMEKAESKLD